MSNFEKIVAVVLLFILSGITLLFIFQIRTNNLVETLPTTVVNKNDDRPVVASAEPKLNKTVENLEQKINDLSASSSALLKRIEELEKQPSTSTISKATTPFQKQIIYMGSASTTQRNWTDSGVEITLNSSDYPSTAKATFEIGLSAIGGEAWARLINKTTGSIMDITEISHATSTTTWKSSPSFKLHTGNNTYALEIKSSSDELANFSGARIVID